MSGFLTFKLIHDPKDAAGAPLDCADVFVIARSEEDIQSTWTVEESDKFWPRDILPHDADLKDSCRVWVLTMKAVDKDLHCFQKCVPLQNFGFGAMNAIEHAITSDPNSASGKSGKSDKLKPNNGTVVLVGHGLGGLLAEMIATLVLELSSATLQGHHLGLKQKHWRLILLGTPHLGSDDGSIIDDIEQMSAIVNYHGGSSKDCDIYHTRGFWTGTHQHAQALVDNDWEKRGFQPPTDAHGTLQVASFQEGVEDEGLIENRQHLRPNAENNGFVVQPVYSLFGGRGLYGLNMSEPPPTIFPCLYRNMGKFEDENDQRWRSFRAVLKEMIKTE